MESREDLNRDSIRAYLTMVAASMWPRRLRGKLGLSDIVQETLVQAYLQYDQRKGTEEAQFRAWLRAILTHTGLDWIKRFGAQKRDAELERSIHGDASASALRLENLLSQPGEGPDARLLVDEQVARLADALPSLPENQRDAVTMYYIEGLKYREVAEAMETTVTAVSGLIRRGLQTLRELLADMESST